MNHLVFLYEVQSKPDDACKMAHTALEDAIAELDNIGSDYGQDFGPLGEVKTPPDGWLRERHDETHGAHDGWIRERPDEPQGVHDGRLHERPDEPQGVRDGWLRERPDEPQGVQGQRLQHIGNSGCERARLLLALFTRPTFATR